MRGMGQIAELCEVAEPDVGAITNVGPVHLELLGTLDAIVEAKAEILRGLRERGKRGRPRGRRGARAPPARSAVDDQLRRRGGRVRAQLAGGGRIDAGIGRHAATASSDFRFPFTEAHNLTNALAAIAIGVALDAPLPEMARTGAGDSLLAPARRAARVARRRVDRERLLQRQPDLDASRARPPRVARRAGRRIAVLGDMAELGPEWPAYHREVGAHARDLGIGPLLGVGELARDYAPDELGARRPRRGRRRSTRLVEPGDAVLVKGSRSVGLELLTDELVACGSRGPRASRDDAAARPGHPAALPDAIDRGEVLIAGMAAMLITIFLGPRFIECDPREGVRPADPRGGPAGAPREGGHADDGRPDHLRRDRRPLPGALRPRHAEPRRVRRRARQRGASASPTTTSRSRSAARSASRRGGSCSSRSRSRSGCGGSRPRRSASTRAIEVRVFDAELHIGPVLYVVLIFLVIAGASNGVNLSDGLDGLAAGCLRDRPARLHGDHDHQRAGGPRGALGLPRRGLGRLPMVQRLPGVDIHGRHRLARPRRRRSARSP